jgi:hypothetical protein
MDKVQEKWITDFFIIKKKHHWFLIPTPVFYYHKYEFLETGVYTPSWGLTIRWLIFMAGVQSQKAYSKK